MADFEKVPTGHKRRPAQWPAVRVRVHAGAGWPKVRLRHGPIARWLGGVTRSLRWGTV